MAIQCFDQQVSEDALDYSYHYYLDTQQFQLSNEALIHLPSDLIVIRGPRVAGQDQIPFLSPIRHHNLVREATL